MRPFLLPLGALLACSLGASAETLDVTARQVTEWKPVYGEVETRDVLPARARIGGTVVDLRVTEGDRVEAGQTIAIIEDEKLGLQIDALDAQREALDAQLSNARTELDRGKQLAQSGAISSQRLDTLQTAVDVLVAQIASNEAQRTVLQRQIEEGAVLAPEAGSVLDVPVSRGSVVVQGEPLATIGAGGVFLRLAVPERFATSLEEGDPIVLQGAEGEREGTIAKLYPQIESGRVQADVEVEGLEGRYVGLRLPVRLPVGQREAILVPDAALSRGGGLDFVTVATAEGEIGRVVVPGQKIMMDGEVWREILTGLNAGDRVVIDHE